MRLVFYGAARTVTGSCFLLEAAGRRLLIDCGMFQGGKEMRERNRQSFPFRPAELDLVLLTHAHIDHSGLLPKLVREGYRGPILATPATADLCTVMLPDAAHIQEMETEWRNRKAQRAGRPPEEPLYTLADAERTLALFRPVKYGAEAQLFPGLRVRFLDAGHILGSAIIEVWAREGERELKVVFSGDLGQQGAPIIRDPTTVAEADFLLLESTYGDRLHEDIGGRRNALAEVVRATARDRGNLVIPAFAVERTQELLYDLRLLLHEGAIPPLPVYIDSPMAVSATEIFRRHPDCFDAETWAMLSQGESPFDFPGLTFIRTAEESRALNEKTGGAIIISANGMCEAGRILHHLKHNLWRPEAHLLFVGYQAEGTLGRRLLEGEKTVRVLGEEIYVRAKIHNIASYSAHADRDGLLRWLAALRQKPRAVFLVHGENAVFSSWSLAVQKALGVPVFVPSYGEAFALAAQAALVATAASGPVDEWAALLQEVEEAYRGLRARLPAKAPADARLALRLRRRLRRAIAAMAKVG
ncbi:MAG: MBL fold metallo-hydrolase RNA specificity domain-containing protein [Bacillota bacterium]